MGAPGGGRSTLRLPWRRQRREVTSRCSVSSSSQRPVTHRAHPAPIAETSPRRVAGIPSTPYTPERAVSWRSTATYEPPRARPEPASLSRGTRSGRLQDKVLRGDAGPALSAALSGSAGFAPFSYTLRDRFSGPHARAGARGPLSVFRKIHLYGKTKKSTHGHQTTKPFCTHFFKIL